MIKKLILVFLTFIILLIPAYFYEKQALSFHFVDEENNMALAKQMLGGNILYKDIFSNHQPLAYIISARIQKATDPNSIFLLIKRHREFMIVLSFLCLMFLVYRFGLPLLLFAIIYELTKIYLLGNLFLSESLAVFPLVYLVSLVFLVSKKLGNKELMFTGFCFFTVLFLLSPLWPLILLLEIILLVRNNNYLNNFGLFLLGGVPVFVICFIFSSFPDYLFSAIYLNTKYYIPLNSSDSFSVSVFKGFTAPLQSFFVGGSNAILRVTQLLSAVVIIGFVLILQKKNYKLAILLISVLGLANLRYIQPGEEYYLGFHLLPWFALLIFSSIFCLVYIYKKFSEKAAIILCTVLLMVIGVILCQGQNNLFRSNDIKQDAFINYSLQFTMGEMVRVMARDKESLFVAPDEWLIYWQSGLKPPVRLNSYYSWMDESPELKYEKEQMFNKYPPMYFYCNCDENVDLYKYTSKYVRLIKDGEKTNLYVLPQKMDNLTKEQKEQLRYHGFTIN